MGHSRRQRPHWGQWGGPPPRGGAGAPSLKVTNGPDLGHDKGLWWHGGQRQGKWRTLDLEKGDENFVDRRKRHRCAWLGSRQTEKTGRSHCGWPDRDTRWLQVCPVGHHTSWNNGVWPGDPFAPPQASSWEDTSWRRMGSRKKGVKLLGLIESEWLPMWRQSWTSSKNGSTFFNLN
jgi:hypothetical protein